MKIFLSGDVMTGRGIDQIQLHHVDPVIYEGYMKDARKYVTIAESQSGKIPRSVDAEYIWGDALSLLNEKKPDLRIINLETAVTTNPIFVPKGINYRMHPDNISILSSANIDICTLSNNHVLDWDRSGMDETIASLDKNYILHAGAGATLGEAQAPAIFESPEGRVLVFSLSHPSSGVPLDWRATNSKSGVFLLSNLGNENFQIVREVIEKYKKPDDIIIISIHWGSNWGYDISEEQIKFAHALIDQASVNIIHGHSSHHPRPIEIYKGRPIIYGCGDFINDYEGISGHAEFRDDLALMYFIGFEAKPFKLQNIELDCLKIKRFQLHRASPRDVNWMRETLVRECKPFSLEFEPIDDNAIFIKI